MNHMAKLDSLPLTHRVTEDARSAPLLLVLMAPPPFLSPRRFDDAVGERDGRRGQRGRPPGSVIQRREQREEEAEGESA